MQRFIFDLEGFILAGGASSRMGVNKAHLTLGGATFLERAARALRTTARTRVVGRTPDAYEWFTATSEDIKQSPFVCDVYRTPDGSAPQSALTGLHAALWHARSPWVAVVACDLPFVTSRLIHRLALLRNSLLRNSHGRYEELHAPESDFEAIVPVQSDGRRQPLCALYRRIPCLRRATEALDRGEYELHSFLATLHTREVSAHELADIPGSRRFFINVNTPEEYAQLRDEDSGVRDEVRTDHLSFHPSSFIPHP